MQRVRHANLAVPLIRKVPRWFLVTVHSPSSSVHDSNSNKPRISFPYFLKIYHCPAIRRYAVSCGYHMEFYMVSQSRRPCVDLKQCWLPSPIDMQETLLQLEAHTT
jgi:hypothetical protein